MADLTITAANVGVSDGNTRTQIVQVGEAVTHMQSVYLDSSTNKYMLADADAAGEDGASGVTITSAPLDGYAMIATRGKVKAGATITVGKIYVLSDTPGGIKPVDDLATGDKVTILGVGVSSTEIDINIIASGVAVP